MSVLRAIPIAFVLLLCCSGHNANSQVSNSPAAKRFYLEPFPTEDKVRDTIKMGMKREEILSIFGEPRERMSNIVSKISGDTYMERPVIRAISYRNRFSGFEIRYDGDSRVINWFPVYSDSILTGTDTVIVDSESKSELENRRLAFYAVELKPISIKGMRYIDTPNFSKLGYIKTEPDLVITNLESIELRMSANTNDARGYTIEVKLMKETSEEFEAFSKRNLGKRVLMMMDDRPIFAPNLMFPLTGGVFEILGLEKKQAEELMLNFKRQAK